MALSPKYSGRLYAFQFLYRNSIHNAQINENIASLISDFEKTLNDYADEESKFIKIENKDKEIGKYLIEDYMKYIEQVNDQITNYLHRVNFENISVVEKTLLKLGYYEIKFTKDAFSSIINDYVELAKKFGTKDSYSMVNGVLDNVRKSI